MSKHQFAAMNRTHLSKRGEFRAQDNPKARLNVEIYVYNRTQAPKSLLRNPETRTSSPFNGISLVGPQDPASFGIEPIRSDGATHRSFAAHLPAGSQPRAGALRLALSNRERSADANWPADLFHPHSEQPVANPALAAGTVETEAPSKRREGGAEECPPREKSKQEGRSLPG